MGFFSNKGKRSSGMTASEPKSRSWHGRVNAMKRSVHGSFRVLKRSESEGDILDAEARLCASLERAREGHLKKLKMNSFSHIPPLIDERCSNSSKDALQRSLHGLKRSLHGMARRFSGPDKSQTNVKPRYIKSCLKKPYLYDDMYAQPPKYKKHVHFHIVDVREYGPSIDHNPCPKDCLAVSISWEFICQPPMSVDAYERRRPPKKKHRDQLKLDYVTRVKMLRVGGFTMKEIQKAIEITRKARNHRMQTLRKVRAEDAKNFVLQEEYKRLQLARRCVEEFKGMTRDY